LFGVAADSGGRALMQWNGLKFAGFSQAKPWIKAGEQFTTFNVADETNDPDSLLSHYRELIALREAHAALRTGDLFLPATNNPRVFACLRTTTEESLLVLVNLTGTPIRGASMLLPSSPLPEGDYTVISLMDETALKKLTVFENGQILNYVPVVEIPPYATIMMKLER